MKQKGGLGMTLVAMGLGIFVIANDFSAMNVALTTMEKDLHSDLSTTQWVINAYALVFGVLIVTGGRLADMFGRRKILFIGAAVFATFSFLGGIAPTMGTEIAARALMGIGGAMMWPAILGLTFQAVGPARAGFAGGLILGLAGLGNAIGPLVGGALTEYASWRWILILNVPIAAFTVLVTYLKVHPPAEKEQDHKIDYPGVATLSLGLVALLFALDQSSEWGWGDPRIVACLVACPLLLVAFGFIERRAGEHALIPRDVMNANFTAACVATLLASVAFFGPVLFLPQYMQKHLGFNPFEAGLGMLPMLATFATVSFLSGRVYDRIGAKATVTMGAAFMAAGLSLIALLGDGGKLPSLVPGMAVLGVGVGFFYSATTTAGVTSVAESRSSLAGGILYMFQVAGGSVLLGVTTAVFTAEEKTNGFVDAFQRALGLDALIGIGAFVVAALFVGGRIGRSAAAKADAGP